MSKNDKSKEVVDELFRRTRIAVGENDPLVLTFHLANIILEKQSDLTAERVSVIAAGFEHTAEKTANSIVETLNKSAGILQLLLNEIAAAKKSISLPELLEEKYVKPQTEKTEDSFKDKLFKMLVPVGFFALGSFATLFMGCFLWVFLR